jgi:hypothetical protein
MAVIEIIYFSAKPLQVANTIQKAVNALKGAKIPRHFVFGTQVQDKGAVQITSELDGVNVETTPESSSFVNNLRSVYGEPQNNFHVSLSQSAFGPDGPATANVVEYVQTYFPTSLVTPSFQKQIEEDFFRFDEIYSKGAKGTVSWAFGWVLEELDHEGIKGEKAKCCFVMRGWESMGLFEESVRNGAYKEAIPLLLAWKAPWKMVGGCFFADIWRLINGSGMLSVKSLIAATSSII